MSRVRVDRSSPDVVDVVLREGVGPLVFAAKRWPGEVLGSLVAGAVCGIPVYVVMALIFSLEPGRIWALVGIAAVLGLVVNTFVILYGAFRDVNRLRFSPAASPDTMTVVRGSRTDRPRPLTDVRQIWIDHAITESHEEDRKPVNAKITLYVLLKNGHLIRPTSLPRWTTDTTALCQELQQVLAPSAVQVDLVVRRRVQYPSMGGHGGSTGGGS
ncbi:hypothetical protein OG871_37600 [Kitasatospora sp. NBC_00374]|uniref:hypothetical protein n=1 Tax=Kitasatospora sp. NBC_00374 TaxID=2975964 RepID=UPI0030E0CD77